MLIAAQQFIFALRPPSRLKVRATGIKVKLNFKKKINILGIVPNGHLGASHDSVHLLLFVGVLSIPDGTFQGIPLLCCAWSFFMHQCVLFSVSIYVGNVSIYVKKSTKFSRQMSKT